MKYKAHGKKPNEEGEKLWFSLDLICIERERDLEYYLKHKRNNPNSNLEKPLFTSLTQYLIGKSKNFDCEEFFNYACALKRSKTFDNIKDAEYLISLFNELDIPPPDSVFDCFHEAYLRSEFIKKVVAKKGVLWDEQEKEDFLMKVTKEINAASIDEEGAKKEVKEMFYIKGQELKKLFISLKEQFNVSISEHFLGEEFIANEEDINYYFMDGERHSGGIQAYHTLRSNYQEILLIKFQMQILRQLIKPGGASIFHHNTTEAFPQKKLSIKEIALLLNYKNVIADRSKCSELIKEYGHTSGDKLYNEFVHFSSIQNRKGYPGTLKKWENQIERIQNILSHLSGESKQQALKELETLKSINKQE